MRALLVALAYVGATLAANDPHIGNLLPGAYMVELSTAPSKRFEDVHADFLNELDRRTAGKFTTRKKYSSPIFNGIAVQLQTPEDLVGLASIPNVVSVRPITIHPAPAPVNVHVLEGPNDRALVADGQSTHIMTGVDKVHAKGITGKGIKIGVIDTGVDYLHPNLGGGFGEGFPVAGGTDLVGDDYTGSNSPVPGDDPRDCAGHGTHVAGIIIANGPNDYNISGVAYDSTLYAYRVFGCAGGSADDVVIDAMLRAFDDGMDIISMSLGSGNGWSTDTLALVASRIADRGRVVTVAVGNDGDAGPLFVSSPATGQNVIAVGSVENTAPMQAAIITNVEHAPIPYWTATGSNVPGLPLPVGSTPYPVFAVTSDPLSEDAACQPLPDDTPDLSSYAVVLRVGSGCSTFQQYVNIANMGASVVVLYNNSDPLPLTIFEAVNLWNDEDGIFLVDEFSKGTNITVAFPQVAGTVPVPNTGSGGLVSDFSSFGPTNDVLFKPSLSAPGGNITSTWLTSGTFKFAELSGTSMAAPFIAGAAALVLQAKGMGAAKNMREILETTAIGVPSSNDPGALPQTLAQQGAGLLNVYAALTATTDVSPGELLLNDTAHWKSVHPITIKNTGKAKQTYALTHVPAGTTVTIPNGANDIQSWPVPLIDADVSVQFSQSKVTILPGLSAIILVTVNPPTNVDARTLPIVSGWVNIASDAGDNLRVSYMGIASPLRSAETINSGFPSSAYLVPIDGGLPALIPSLVNTHGPLRAQKGAKNYTLDSLPVYAFVMAQGTQRLVVDLITPDTPINSTIPDPLEGAQPIRRRSPAPVPAWSGWWPGLFPKVTGAGAGTFAAVPVVGTLFEFADVVRNAMSNDAEALYELDFPSQFANGTAIPFGQYKLLMRSLRLTGDPKNEDDYDVYVSQQLGLVETL